MACGGHCCQDHFRGIRRPAWGTNRHGLNDFGVECPSPARWIGAFAAGAFVRLNWMEGAFMVVFVLDNYATSLTHNLVQYIGGVRELAGRSSPQRPGRTVEEAEGSARSAFWFRPDPARLRMPESARELIRHSRKGTGAGGVPPDIRRSARHSAERSCAPRT